MRVTICDRCEGAECDARLWCMCGSEMGAHDWSCGHSPVSMHDYCGTEHRVMDWGPFMEAMAYCAAACACGLVVAGLLDYYRTAEVAAYSVVGFLTLYLGGAVNHYREWSE